MGLSRKPVYSEDYIWRTQAGEEIAIKDMTDIHICRLLVYVEKRALTNPHFRHRHEGFGDFLRTQIIQRGLVNFFTKEFNFSVYAKPVLVEDLKSITPNQQEVAKLVNHYFVEAPKESED